MKKARDIGKSVLSGNAIKVVEVKGGFIAENSIVRAAK